LQAAQARERALSAELKQLQQTLAEQQEQHQHQQQQQQQQHHQQQQQPEFPGEEADSQGQRQRVRLRLQRVARDVSDLNLLLKNLSEGKNVPMALLVQDKRHLAGAALSNADEEVLCCGSRLNQPQALQELLASLSANAASMLHLVRERVADSIGQQCSTQ
jgi:hypothetical protein